jgi:hypothetical protein
MGWLGVTSAAREERETERVKNEEWVWNKADVVICVEEAPGQPGSQHQHRSQIIKKSSSQHGSGV